MSKAKSLSPPPTSQIAHVFLHSYTILLLQRVLSISLDKWIKIAPRQRVDSNGYTGTHLSLPREEPTQMEVTHFYLNERKKNQLKVEIFLLKIINLTYKKMLL